MRWSKSSASVVVAAALAGCTTAATVSPSSGQRTAVRPSGLVDLVPFALTTHCGIHELSFRGKYFVRSGGTLDDGQGNLPAGWDNPTQLGSLLVFTTYAVFTDAKGHRVTFTLRPGATGFEEACS